MSPTVVSPIRRFYKLGSFLDLEGGSQKATLVVLVVVVIGSLKIPNAFIIRICAHILYSTVSDF